MTRSYKTISFSALESQEMNGVLSRAGLIHSGLFYGQLGTTLIYHILRFTIKHLKNSKRNTLSRTTKIAA